MKTNIHDQLRNALMIAQKYVIKGIEKDAYKGCVISGEKALITINQALANAH